MFPITNQLLIYDAPASLDIISTGEIVDFVPSNPKDLQVEECSICLQKLSTKNKNKNNNSSGSHSPVQIQKCLHKFHRHCLEDSLFQNNNNNGRHNHKNKKCPFCGIDVLLLQGHCPSGIMEVKCIPSKCPGFDVRTKVPTTTAIEVKYTIPRGKQRCYHDHPGKCYEGTIRVAYLPDNQLGRKLLIRMQYAWMCGLTFTMGTFMKSGRREDVVVWNRCFEHKTSLKNGDIFGFPDPLYISSNNKRLTEIGVPNADACRAQLATLIANNNNNNNSKRSTIPTVPGTTGALASAAASVASAVSSAFFNRIRQRVKYPNNSSRSLSNVRRETLTYTAPRVLQSASSKVDAFCETVSPSSIGSYYDCCWYCPDTLLSAKKKSLVRIKQCRHVFHRSCLEECFTTTSAIKCPECCDCLNKPQGKCPSGTMTIKPEHNTCPGFGLTCLAIRVEYTIPCGKQQSYHDHPGIFFSSTHRIAYLPNNVEGRHLLARLKYAWMHGLTFTIGTLSLTTGMSDVVVWTTSIHHKTSLMGGSPHGFPDSNYLFRCNSQLDALGIPTDPTECLEELANMCHKK